MAGSSPPESTYGPIETTSVARCSTIALVEALEAGGEQRQRAPRRRAPRRAPGRAGAPAGRARSPAASRRVAVDGLERRVDDVDAQHHPGAAAVGLVVDLAARERREVAVVERRRSSSEPSTAASGRCSVSQAKACGSRVKTSICMAVVEISLRAANPGATTIRPSSRSTARTQSSTSGSAMPPIELEHVVRHARRHVLARGRARGRPPRPTVEADELEDVERVVVPGGRKLARRAARARRRASTARSSRIDEPRRRRASTRPRSPARARRRRVAPTAKRSGVVARALDDERARRARAAGRPARPRPSVARASARQRSRAARARRPAPPLARTSVRSARAIAALPADHLADVVLGDVEPQDDGAVALRPLDAHLVRAGRRAFAREVGEQLLHVSALGCPAVFIRRFTGSLGCAPFAIQSWILSSSSSIVDGSVCGL